MQDGKALQMGTSHNLGDHFAKAYDITYLSREGRHEYCFTTSWGVSTRMIGGLIMTHGDDRGLMFPPRIAPVQLIILPIAQHKPGVLDKAYELKKMLSDAGIRVELDDSDQSAGWKFNQWEMKGVPVRLEIGRRTSKTIRLFLFAAIRTKNSSFPSTALQTRSNSCLIPCRTICITAQKKIVLRILSLQRIWTSLMRVFKTDL